MKTQKQVLVAMSAFLLISTPLPWLSPINEVQAVADTFTLTKVGVDKISVVLNGTPQVQLPNGAIVTSNTTFTVKENKTYTFTGIDGAVKVQKPITITTVPDNVPLLIVSPNEKVFLNFEAGDTHSGVKDMRYVAYNEATGQSTTPFTSWEAFKLKKAWVVPAIPAKSSSTWAVKAEFRDNAGNIASNVIGRFFIDNVPPVNTLVGTVDYTNVRNINVIANIMTKFEVPATGYVGLTPTGAFQSYDLTKLVNTYKGTTTGDERKFQYALPYLLPVAEGIHKIHFKSDKRQHTQVLTSDVVTKNVVYDKTAPTGSVVINDGELLLPVQEVKLTIKTDDNLSGVDKIKIVEKSESGIAREKVIEDPSPTQVIDWTLSPKDKTYVEVVIYDNSGNQTVVRSQEVSFAKLNIVKMELTNNRNPAVYHAGNPFTVRTWSWLGDTEPMLANSNFDFKMYYDLGLGQSVNYNVTGNYVMQVRTPSNVTTYTSGKLAFDSSQPVVNGFSGTRVQIPKNTPIGSQIWITSDMKAVHKQNTKLVSETTFAPVHIGTVGDTIGNAVNEIIQFNELN